MTNTNVLELVGLGLGFVSGWILAYPILWGYPKLWPRRYKEIQLANLREHIRRIDAETDALPWSLEEKAQVKKEFHDARDPDVRALENEIERLGPGHERLSFFLSAIGMTLLTTGFAIQLLAVLSRTEAVPVPPDARLGVVAMPGLPAFGDATAVDAPGDFRDAVCEARRLLNEAHASLAIVVGRHDVRELGPDSVSVYSTNVGLAQRRADRVASLLQQEDLCSWPAVVRPLAFTGGPRLTERQAVATPRRRSEQLARDRAVEIYGVRVWFETK